MLTYVILNRFLMCKIQNKGSCVVTGYARNLWRLSDEETRRLSDEVTWRLWRRGDLETGEIGRLDVEMNSLPS